MENFIVKTVYSKNDFLRQNNVYWKYHSIKFRKQISIYIISSISLIIIGELLKSEDEPSNPFIYMGIFFSVLTASFLYLRIFQKINYKRKIEAIAKRYDEIKLDNEIEFTDEFFKYKDKIKCLEYKWEVFSNYIVYKNHIFLSSDLFQVAVFIFEKEEENKEEFLKILDFISLKVANQKSNTAAKTI